MAESEDPEEPAVLDDEITTELDRLLTENEQLRARVDELNAETRRLGG